MNQDEPTSTEIMKSVPFTVVLNATSRVSPQNGSAVSDNVLNECVGSAQAGLVARWMEGLPALLPLSVPTANYLGQRGFQLLVKSNKPVSDRRPCPTSRAVTAHTPAPANMPLMTGKAPSFFAILSAQPYPHHSKR